MAFRLGFLRQCCCLRNVTCARMFVVPLAIGISPKRYRGRHSRCPIIWYFTTKSISNQLNFYRKYQIDFIDTIFQHNTIPWYTLNSPADASNYHLASQMPKRRRSSKRGRGRGKPSRTMPSPQWTWSG